MPIADEWKEKKTGEMGLSVVVEDRGYGTML